MVVLKIYYITTSRRIDGVVQHCSNTLEENPNITYTYNMKYPTYMSILHMCTHDVHIHVCGALVQFSCYQHKHKINECKDPRPSMLGLSHKAHTHCMICTYLILVFLYSNQFHMYCMHATVNNKTVTHMELVGVEEH